jgi:hypothetical protein
MEKIFSSRGLSSHSSAYDRINVVGMYRYPVGVYKIRM